MLKKILILYPHFPPSNLAGVHRPRLFAQHLPTFGWEPIILTVHEKFYEEALDHHLETLLPPSLRIEKVNAFGIGSFRFIGDLGLRAFLQLYKKAKQIIKNDQIDFLYIPIPSFYCALLGRWLNATTGIKYGIDYIDPWVHEFPGSNQLFSRHWFSTKLAKLLEPVAVKNVSLITGVGAGYFEAVLLRNPALKKFALTAAMPYGGEAADHNAIAALDKKAYLYNKNARIKLVYAGAMLPKAYGPLEMIFKSIHAQKNYFSNIEFYFIGTGKSTTDDNGFNIKPLAQKYGLWQTVVFEYPKRIPYLDVLVHLDAADGIFILGSTEPHYTPSKVYQAVLARKPILAVLHEQSSAVEVLKQSGAGKVLTFDGENGLEYIEQNFTEIAKGYLNWLKIFDTSAIDMQIFDEYSAKNVTRQLVSLLNKVVP